MIVYNGDVMAKKGTEKASLALGREGFPLRSAFVELLKRNRFRESAFGDEVWGGKRGSLLHDPLEKLGVIKRLLSPQAARALYGASWFARNVVDVISEDMTRRWCVVHTGDEGLDKTVEDYLRFLEARSRFHDLVRHDLIYGNGIMLVAAEDGADMKSPLRADKLKAVKFLNVISPLHVSIEGDIDEDVGSPTYGEIVQYRFSKGGKPALVHSSRVLHLAMRALYGEKWGSSVFIPMLQIIKVLDSAEWSAGQILYSLVTKVIKGNFSGLTDAEERALQEELDQSLNMITTILLGKSEEFEYKSPAGVTQGVQALLDFVWECAAGAARIPRTHLIGQQAGAIAGAREDTKTYYGRIAGLQDSYLVPLLERLVKMILVAKDGGGLSLEAAEEIPLEIVFNPLGIEDEQAKAQVFLDKAKAVQILVDTGIMDIESAKGVMEV